ncbi:unnamed protein product [Lactuca saligna]|uniref:Uncharacterized protein n=1 Tax=Lactuca saligna TaxID=75948 RepID=A0AA35ZBH5_LACSI|nr:unnamed protein product [Lactuca saligna]
MKKPNEPDKLDNLALIIRKSFFSSPLFLTNRPIDSARVLWRWMKYLSLTQSTFKLMKKNKSVSRCKVEFLNALCEDSDDELVEGEGENTRVEVDDEKNTKESSDEDEIVYEGQMECDETGYWRNV